MPHVTYRDDETNFLRQTSLEKEPEVRVVRCARFVGRVSVPLNARQYRTDDATEEGAPDVDRVLLVRKSQSKGLEDR